MPSHLRLQSSFEEPIEAQATYQTSPTLPPKKKQRMSLTQTYYVASTARSKLGREAGRADHNLRLLVGHANLLDSLMLELQDAEREQEAWFNNSVRTAAKSEEPRHVQWIDSIPEMDEDSDSDDESEDGSDVDEEEFSMIAPPRARSPPASFSSSAIIDDDEDDEDMEFDDEYEDSELSLTRVASKHSPPELTMDDDEDSSDEDECPSPENIELELSEKERQQIATSAFYDIKSQKGLEDYVVAQPETTLIAAAC